MGSACCACALCIVGMLARLDSKLEMSGTGADCGTGDRGGRERYLVLPVSVLIRTEDSSAERGMSLMRYETDKMDRSRSAWAATSGV